MTNFVKDYIENRKAFEDIVAASDYESFQTIYNTGRDRYTKLLNMNIHQMSHYFGDELKVCCYEGRPKRCPLIGGCSSCWKNFLQECVE
jgi:hypothetical protein